MLNFAIFCELKNKLLEISELTKKLNEAPGSFTDACVSYLSRFETFAAAQRLYVASDVSLCLDKILTMKSERPAAGTARHNIRKERDAYAVNCLEALHTVVKTFLEKEVRTFGECGDMWRQVLARALAKGYRFDLLPAAGRADAIVAALKNDEEFVPYYAHISGLVGVLNAAAVLDTTLPELAL